MGMINISSQGGDSTYISNTFIEYYMSDANGDFVKLYLYLSMLSQSGKAITLSDIADHMGCTDKDVCRAIRYWIKNDVLSLSYDEDGEVTGITLRALKRPEVELTTGLKVVGTSLLVDSSDASETTVKKSRKTEPSEKKVKYTAEDNAEENSEPEVHAPRKKQPSSEQLNEMLTDNELQNLISEAEAYCKRDLAQKELNSLIYIKDQLKLSFDLCEYLLEYCAEIKKTSFSYIEKVAINWYEEGIVTREEAEEYTDHIFTLYSKILKALGIKNRFSPAPIEKKFIRKWTKDFGFTDEIIIEACNRAITNKPHDAGFPYVNGILEDWHNNGVDSFAKISEMDEKHNRKKNAKSIGNTGDEAGRDNTDKLQQLEDFYLNGGRKV